MSADRDEIRDHLAAVIEAARELPRDDRAYLADTFLDDLETRYQLVPRQARGRRPLSSGTSWLPALPAGWPLLRLGFLVLAAMVVVSVAMLAFSVLIHPPVLLLLVLLFLVFRSTTRRGPRRRGPGHRIVL